jgi:hypothetical protein
MKNRRITKIVSMVLPYGIVLLRRKYLDYQMKYNHRAGKEYVFDVIFSAGVDCRPAHYLQKHHLRLCANPLDWMMSYSLDTVFHLYQSKFEDFFVDVKADQQNEQWFIDVKNDIISIHYPEVGSDGQAFTQKMKNRFDQVNERLTRAGKICFVSNRKEDPDVLSFFLQQMSTLYPGEITLINIRNNEAKDGVECTRKKVTDRLILVEYAFNDIHPNGNDRHHNPHFWLGNVPLWDEVMGKIAVRMSFIAYLFKKDGSKWQ